MVDGVDLRLSEFYFAVLHILRIAADWIQESMDDLGRTVEHMEWCYSSLNNERLATGGSSPPAFSAQDTALDSLRQNWESVISHQQRLGNALLARIARKQEHVKSLGDGVREKLHLPRVPSSSIPNSY